MSTDHLLPPFPEDILACITHALCEGLVPLPGLPVTNPAWFMTSAISGETLPLNAPRTQDSYLLELAASPSAITMDRVRGAILCNRFRDAHRGALRLASTSRALAAWMDAKVWPVFHAQVRRLHHCLGQPLGCPHWDRLPLPQFYRHALVLAFAPTLEKILNRIARSQKSIQWDPAKGDVHPSLSKENMIYARLRHGGGYSYKMILEHLPILTYEEEMGYPQAPAPERLLILKDLQFDGDDRVLPPDYDRAGWITAARGAIMRRREEAVTYGKYKEALRQSLNGPLTPEKEKELKEEKEAALAGAVETLFSTLEHMDPAARELFLAKVQQGVKRVAGGPVPEGGEDGVTHRDKRQRTE